ncbi:MAG: hypothetical protein AcusKO_01970 [Acuticoccus sp.]
MNWMRQLVAVDRGGERCHRLGLGKTRRAFQKDMPVGQKRDEDLVDKARLADDLAVDVTTQAFKVGMGRFTVHLRRRTLVEIRVMFIGVP